MSSAKTRVPFHEVLRDEEIKRENKMLLGKMVSIERKTSIVGLM